MLEFEKQVRCNKKRPTNYMTRWLKQSGEQSETFEKLYWNYIDKYLMFEKYFKNIENYLRTIETRWVKQSGEQSETFNGEF